MNTEVSTKARITEVLGKTGNAFVSLTVFIRR